MRKYFILFFLILNTLFNNKVGECSLWELDFKGYITRINTSIPGGWRIPSEDVADILGVSIGSKMKASHIYETDPYAFSLTHYGFIYPLIFDFQTFRIGGSPHLHIMENGDIQYGNFLSGALSHEDGWATYIYGYGFYFSNKTGISYTLESLPTVLNLDNFDVAFSFSGEIPNTLTTIPGDDIFAGAGGVIDHINVHPVPEPSTLLLLGCGLVGLAVLGRKKLT